MNNFEKYRVHGVIAIIALIVGFIGGTYWQANHKAGSGLNGYSTSTTSSTTQNNGSDTVMSVANKTYSIFVPNQVAGDHVVIESLTVKEGSWVVITEDVAGAPGRILGAQKFFPGMITGSVDLLRNTVRGNTYHALIYSDNGDNQFDFKVDGPITDNDSKTIESVFTVS